MRKAGKAVAEQHGRVGRVASLVYHQLDSIDGNETGGDRQVLVHTPMLTGSSQ